MRTILFFICFLSVIILQGQITYSANNHYSVGSNIEYEITNIVSPNLDFSTTGENTEWEYLEFNQTRTDTVEFIDPNDSGYRSSFCLSNFYIFNCDSKFGEITNIATLGLDTLGFGEIKTENIVRHFLKNEDSYSETMIGVSAIVNGVSIPVSIEYEEADVLLNFPLEYENVDSSNSRLVMDLEPVGVNARIARNSKRINAIDGYGSLKTPAGSYSEVLKMKTLIYNTDTTSYDSLSLPVSSIMVEYKWFAEGFSGPVLEASGLVLLDSEVITEVRYQRNAEVSSLSNIGLNNYIKLYPNPFSSSLNINAGDYKIDAIRIYNLLGQCVYSINSEKTISNLQPILPSGNYVIEMFSEGERVAVQKITSLR